MAATSYEQLCISLSIVVSLPCQILGTPAYRCHSQATNGETRTFGSTDTSKNGRVEGDKLESTDSKKKKKMPDAVETSSTDSDDEPSGDDAKPSTKSPEDKLVKVRKNKET